MTPYEKRFQSLQRKNRIVTKQAKATENPADVTWIGERRAAINVKAGKHIIKRD